MRANEIMEVPTSAAQNMLLKLRKGASASLNGARFTELLPYLPGWSIAKDKQYRLSDGGWILNNLGGAKGFRSYSSKKKNDGRIYLECAMPRDLSEYQAWGGGEETQQKALAADQEKYAHFMRVVDYLKSIQDKPQGGNRFIVKDVQVGEVIIAEYGNAKFAMASFELWVMTGGFVITSPEGETYEVFGDYKNGAIGATTFDSFFKWAAANTDIMDQINAALQMEPHEKKIDPSKPYTPPPTASKETKLVFDFLKEMTTTVRAEQKVHYIEKAKQGVERFVAAYKAGDKKTVEAITSGNDGFIISRVWDSKTKALRPDWETTVDTLCEEAVEAMQNKFVYKNTHKLASILTAKGSVGTHKILHIDTRSGIITASIQFSFDDGSSFVVNQSIVISVTRDGWGNYTDPFYRFPTTFHDVILPGGVKMGMPSEERMNEIFAKA